MATIPERKSPWHIRETQSGPATIKRAAHTAFWRHLLRFATVALLVVLATGQMQLRPPLAAFNGFTMHSLGACGGGAGLPC